VQQDGIEGDEATWSVGAEEAETPCVCHDATLQGAGRGDEAILAGSEVVDLNEEGDADKVELIAVVIVCEALSKTSSVRQTMCTIAPVALEQETESTEDLLGEDGGLGGAHKSRACRTNGEDEERVVRFWIKRGDVEERLVVVKDGKVVADGGHKEGVGGRLEGLEIDLGAESLVRKGPRSRIAELACGIA
jgi:hypothetical protein